MLKEIFAIGNYSYLQPDSDFSDKLARVFKTYGMLFLMMMAIAPVLVLSDKLVTDVFHHKSLNMQNRQLFQQMYKKLGMVVSVIFICLIGPVFEELIFRFALSFKKRDVAVSALIALFYFGGSVYHPQWMLLKMVLELLIGAVVFILCRAFIPATPFNLSRQHKKQLVIISICLFGLMHVFNYRPIDVSLIWIYPVFVLPQLLMGWAISYIRLKNGFVWGIALHCLINTVSTVLSYHR